VSFAGATWADPARCAPTAPVSVLEVHGAADPVVRYEGGASLPNHPSPPYPSVDATVATSAAKDTCTGALVSDGTRRGFDADHPKAETEVARFTGCPAGIDVERWKMPEAAHIPNVTPAWSGAVVAWLEGHARP
jgi:polyhydroxybutyrate depolymerase